MGIFVNIIIAIASLILIASIVLQSGKAAGLSGSISGGAEQIFGKNEAKGMDKILDKATKIAGFVFIVGTILAYVV